MSDSGPDKLHPIVRSLERRQAELTAADAATDGDRAPVELDQTSVGRLSRMDALQVQAMAQETSRRRHQELLRIEAALKRVAEGEYGYCTLCGDDIPLKRLELDPATPTCVACANARTP
ncbi:MAG: TraR/DksA C4-type zinc finger protein [Rhodobacterales bacterium]|nr:TraR/DksA C4-type zinc finger protein [Rhodobacterales bacterium]